MASPEEIRRLIISILKKNHRPDVYKNDPRIKASVIRVISDMVAIGMLQADSSGKVMNKDMSSLHSMPNFELLKLLENAIGSIGIGIVDRGFINIVESIDYLGKCWYSATEMAKALEGITLQKHNKEKIRRMMDDLVKEGMCIKLTDKQQWREYRISYMSI